MDHERTRVRNRRVAEWFSGADYASQQRDFFSTRQDGTGEWLLDSDEFQQWKSKSKEALLCTGKAGAGKTIMSSMVIHHLQNDTTIGIAYIYCNYRQHRQHSPEEFLSSLVRQFI